MLVLRTDLSGDPSFVELLRRVRRVALGAYAHQELPFERLVEALQPKRDTSLTPLFQVVFALQNASGSAVKLVDLHMEPLELDNGTTQFDLAMHLWETDQGLKGLVEYNTDLFDRATIIRLIGHFQTLAKAIVADPNRRISALPLVTEAEREQLLLSFSGASIPAPPAPPSLPLALQALASSQPDTIALQASHIQLSFASLHARACQLAHLLLLLGISPDARVALALPPSPDLPLAWLAILYAGAAFIPLDLSYPPARLNHILHDAQPHLLLSNPDVPLSLPPGPWRSASMPSLLADSLAQPSHLPPQAASPDHLAYVIYTSGSTGSPKGVLVSRRGLLSLAIGQRQPFQLAPHRRVLQVAALGFDAAVAEVLVTLLAGATLVLAPPDARLPSPVLQHLLEQQAITTLTLPPSVLAALPQAALPSLSTLVVAGEACPPAVLARWSEGRRIINAYGPTETTVCATLAEASDPTQPPPIGRPLAGLRCYVLDAAGQLLPIGVEGELYVGGVGLARGYHRQPALTAERFVPDGWSGEAGARLYRTGDRVRWLADGRLLYRGRQDGQVKIRGVRVELGEVEAALAEQRQVRESAVVAQAGPEGALRLVGYVVFEGGANGKLSGLREELAARLPAALVPSVLVPLEALPRTPNGKLDRAALPIPDHARPTTHTFVAPRDTLELELAQIWEDVLGVHPIGITDNFFTLGGHSIFAISLMGRILKRFEQDLPLTALLHAPTVEQLANRLRQGGQHQTQSPLVAIKPGGTKPPFFCIHPGGGDVLCYYDLALLLGDDQPFYGLQDPQIYQANPAEISIQDMATAYLEAVRKVWPTGPYLLGGYSFGGIVAFEMALQLQRQGQPPALVAIIDGGTPVLAETFADDDDARFLAIIGLELTRSASGLDLDEIQRELRSRDADAQLEYILELMRRADLDAPQGGTSWVHQHKEMFKSRIRMIKQYTPQVYSGRIVVFRSGEQSADSAPDLGWGALTTGAPVVIAIPGHHETILSQPHVRVLAEHLRASLERALADSVQELESRIHVA